MYVHISELWKVSITGYFESYSEVATRLCVGWYHLDVV